MPAVAVVPGKFKLPSSVMVAAEKFPLPSRLTRVLAVSVLVAVSPSVTAPPTVAAVMSALPVDGEHAGVGQRYRVPQSSPCRRRSNPDRQSP